ncbi:MAG: 50S ribosomal protein L24 [Deltaproteobacteria bacterium]|jgi:large subunit ribosomal protein L24|nr:50S ribosomal protein L24 [Deltaproteobacteria bacterium]
MAAKNRAERLKSKAAAVKSKRLPCPYLPGDTVFVLSGDDKTKSGDFMRYDSKKNRVYLKGRQMVQHYVKANPNENLPGGMTSVELSIHVTNTAYYCSVCGKPTSLRRRVQDSPLGGESETVWVCRRCGAARKPAGAPSGPA